MAEVHEHVVSSAGASSAVGVDPRAVGQASETALPVAMPAKQPAGFDYRPTSLAEARELAKDLADSDLVPKQYQGKPGNVLVAIQWGAELGMKPLQAMQNIAVINGKPSIYGDTGKALLQANGCQIIEWDAREVEGQGMAKCTIKRTGRPDVTRTFTIDDAKRARLWGKEGPWTNYPFRQMAWRAFWFAARDGASDILKGMAGAEELADVEIKDVTPEGSHVTTAQSQSDKVKAQLRRVKVEEVVKAFDDATTIEAGNAATELAKKLVSEEDKDKAGQAYVRFVKRMKKAALEEAAADPANGGPSLADVRDALARAKKEKWTVEQIDNVADVINTLKADDDVKAALRADIATLKADAAKVGAGG